MLVTKSAPDFTAAAVMKDGTIQDSFNFYEQTKDKYSVLFFYPLDFTFVCPTEMVALNKRMQAFTDRGVEVLAISIDSQHTHARWRQTPLDQGGIGAVDYTMVADLKHHICRAYGIEHPAEGVALRASFIISPAKQVRIQMVNDLPVGRNIDEIIRLIDALKFTDEHGEVCPAGWQQGKEAFSANQEGIANYLKENEDAL
ncbi:MAG: peroxiredoxin [Pseudomonadota bacterium]|nr:peroxiredoxin [Pseudomonadota bacterium]